jgi:hypothetical protein
VIVQILLVYVSFLIWNYTLTSKTADDLQHRMLVPPAYKSLDMISVNV